MDQDEVWFDSKALLRPKQAQSSEPVFDTEISKIVGKPVRANDSRLLKLVVKYRKPLSNRVEDAYEPEQNLLANIKFLDELRRTFSAV